MWFIRDLERLAYAMFILRGNINDRVNRYARLLREVERGNRSANGTIRTPAFTGQKDMGSQGTRWTAKIFMQSTDNIVIIVVYRLLYPT